MGELARSTQAVDAQTSGGPHETRPETDGRRHRGRPHHRWPRRRNPGRRPRRERLVPQPSAVQQRQVHPDAVSLLYLGNLHARDGTSLHCADRPFPAPHGRVASSSDRTSHSSARLQEERTMRFRRAVAGGAAALALVTGISIGAAGAASADQSGGGCRYLSADGLQVRTCVDGDGAGDIWTEVQTSGSNNTHINRCAEVVDSNQNILPGSLNTATSCGDPAAMSSPTRCSLAPAPTTEFPSSPVLPTGTGERRRRSPYSGEHAGEVAAPTPSARHGLSDSCPCHDLSEGCEHGSFVPSESKGKTCSSNWGAESPPSPQ